MANRNTRRKRKLESKSTKTGQPVITCFAGKAQNPQNKRRSPKRYGQAKGRR